MSSDADATTERIYCPYCGDHTPQTIRDGTATCQACGSSIDERAYRGFISPEQCATIRDRMRDGDSAKTVAADYPVTKPTILTHANDECSHEIDTPPKDESGRTVADTVLVAGWNSSGVYHRHYEGEQVPICGTSRRTTQAQWRQKDPAVLYDDAPCCVDCADKLPAGVDP